MKNTILTGLILMSFNFMSGQINGLTETGDEVILFEDGTWEYRNEDIFEKVEIPINEEEFLKDEHSTFLVKSNKLNMGMWINPKEWTFTKGTDHEDHEYMFQKKGDDLYAVLISERLQIPIETLKGIAIENARSVATDLKVVKEEYRYVNGIKVLMMQMVGTIQGLDFTYYGYYYSNANGTIQLLSYTGRNLFTHYQDDIEAFINGLVEIH